MGSCVEGRATGPRRHHHGPARVRNLRPGHQKPFSRHEEPDGAADALRPNGPIVKAACAPTTGLSSVDAVREALRPNRPDVRSGVRGSKARPFSTTSRCGKRFVSRGPPSGEQGSTLRVVRLGSSFGEQSSTQREKSRTQRRSPQVSRAGNTGKA